MGRFVVLVFAATIAAMPVGWAGSDLRGRVTARGHLEPRDGVRRIAGPADLVTVVGRLLVKEGDSVTAGAVVAITDARESREARVAEARAAVVARRAAEARARADAESCRQEELRFRNLAREGVAPSAEVDRWEKRCSAFAAALEQASAELRHSEAVSRSARVESDRCVVRSPISGRVLRVHTRPGERVGAEGILEVGETSEMYAVAEVHETDAARVRPGQRAEVTSPALARALEGVVTRVGLRVGRLLAVGTDPAARNDARAVKVWIQLTDTEVARELTDLEVSVAIDSR